MEQTQTLSGPPGLAHPDAPPAIPSFEIIPVRAIPLVGLAIAGLVAAIISQEIWALEFAHVVAGGLWTGIDLFVGLIIGPILGRLSPQGRVEFSTRFMPKMVLLMPTLVAVTLVAGWSLANTTGDIAVAYPDHWWLTASFVVVGIMSVIALGFLEPANLAVLFELKKPRPDPELYRPTDEALRLRLRHHRHHAAGHPDHHDEDRDMVNEQKLPPVSELAIVTMILVVSGGIYMASHIPDEVPTLLPTVLSGIAALVLFVNVLLLLRVKAFAWPIFRQVAGWSLVGYGVISGLLLWVFLRDDIPNDVMSLLAASLVIYAVNIPLLFGFSVARYQPVES